MHSDTCAYFASWVTDAMIVIGGIVILVLVAQSWGGGPKGGTAT